jgi:hypothetical protein
VSGYNIANTKVNIYRGVVENEYGDPQHRLDPDAVIATNVPCTITGAKKTVLVAQDSWDQTSRTPRNIEPLIVRVSVAADKRVPGGIQVSDLLEDQVRDELFAVKSVTKPYATGRQAPDRVFELDRLS